MPKPGKKAKKERRGSTSAASLDDDEQRSLRARLLRKSVAISRRFQTPPAPRSASAIAAGERLRLRRLCACVVGLSVRCSFVCAFSPPSSHRCVAPAEAAARRKAERGGGVAAVGSADGGSGKSKARRGRDSRR